MLSTINDHPIITIAQGPNNALVPREEGPWFLEKLSSLAEAIGAKFSITKWEVEARWGKIEEGVLQFVASHIERQGEEKYLYLCGLSFGDFGDPLDSEKNKIFLTLAKKAKEWKIKYLRMNFHIDQTWLDFTALGLVAKGHIYKLTIYINPQRVKMLEELKRVERLEGLKGVWDKAEKFHVFNSGGYPHFFTEGGGGRGGNPVTDWQRFLDFILS